MIPPREGKAMQPRRLSLLLPLELSHVGDGLDEVFSRNINRRWIHVVEIENANDRGASIKHRGVPI